MSCTRHHQIHILLYLIAFGCFVTGLQDHYETSWSINQDGGVGAVLDGFVFENGNTPLIPLDCNMDFCETCDKAASTTFLFSVGGVIVAIFGLFGSCIAMKENGYNFMCCEPPFVSISLFSFFFHTFLLFFGGMRVFFFFFFWPPS